MDENYEKLTQAPTVDAEKAAKWQSVEALAEEPPSTDWESLASAEYRGEEAPAAPEADLGAKSPAEKLAQLRTLINLDEIAKAEDPEGLAAAERESALRQERLEAHQAELAQKTERDVEVQARRNALPQDLQKAQRDLDAFERKNRRGIFAGLRKLLGIGKKKRAKLTQNLTELENEQKALREESYRLDDERQELREVVAATDVDGPKREFLEKFETPLSPEAKKENLDFAALAQLSTDEYLQLWRRLNPFFMTHVTRQGIRDHNGMVYHSAGMGELHDGMKGVLADEKILRTPAEVRYALGRKIDEQNVGAALDKMLFSTDVNIDAMRARGESDGAILSDLVAGLPVNVQAVAAEPWADKQAVHFAQLTALDDFYGGETGNEAFFVFPTDVLASQCKFGGHMHDGLTTAQVESERKWNDIFVWPEDKDITIDAGLTFLPQSTLVDAETGSKYATKIIEKDGQKIRVPEIDEEAVAKFTAWLGALKPGDENVKLAVEQNDLRSLREAALSAGVPERVVAGVFDATKGFQYDVERFTEGGALADLWQVPEAELAGLSAEERRARSVREFLNGRPEIWKLPDADKAMPAREYWEKHFAAHPEQRPAHVIYYDGDPSAAIVSTLKEAGILEEENLAGISNWEQDRYQRYTGKGDSHERDGDWLGFEENHIAEEDERLQQDHRKFNEIAQRLIAEHYGLKV